MSKMRSVMSHQFSQIPEVNVPRSSFNRNHGHKTTFDAGWLVPVFIDEVLPGDTLNCRMNYFCRMSTPIYPVMDNIFLESFFFFVPNRLVWDNWEKFNGAQTNPGDSTDYLVPTGTSPASVGYASATLQDYLGLPVGVAGIVHDQLPLRAYNLIWNEWFRDQNLQDSVTVDVDDGPDTVSNYVLLKRGKRHDYFTSCLPWPQKGPAVELPLGTSAPVLGIGTTSASYTGPVSGVHDSSQNIVTYAQGQSIDPATHTWYVEQASGVSYPNIYADLTNATAATINSLRQAFQVQRMYERDARGGTRYIEILRSHFGVVSPDARLQRPEYLGGGSGVINVHPVAQTSSTDMTSPQGNLAAFATGSGRGHGFVKSFVEHGWIIGMVCVRADLTYQQGLLRQWSRQTRFDYFWPSFAHLGEQAVLNQEIYCDGSGNDANVFGYQERYAEYRYKPSLITGLFRSNVTAGYESLDAWHLSIDFGSLPALNSTFIVENPPMSRVLTTDTEFNAFIFDSYFEYKCARPMPTYSVPGLIDHF